jgi:hypothetical protein
MDGWIDVLDGWMGATPVPIFCFGKRGVLFVVVALRVGFENSDWYSWGGNLFLPPALLPFPHRLTLFPIIRMRPMGSGCF